MEMGVEVGNYMDNLEAECWRQRQQCKGPEAGGCLVCS